MAFSSSALFSNNWIFYLSWMLLFSGIAYGINAFIAARKELAFLGEFKKYLDSNIHYSSAEEIINGLKKKNMPEDEIVRTINSYYSSRLHPPFDKAMRLTSTDFKDERLEKINNIIHQITEPQFSKDGAALAEIIGFEFPGFEEDKAAHSLAYAKLYTELYRDKYYFDKNKKESLNIPEDSD